MSALDWTVPWLAAAAVPAGVLVTGLARHRFGRGRAAFAWSSAAARGAAVALAAFAAAGPHVTDALVPMGERFLATSDAVPVPGADRVVRWGGGTPDAARDAASAVETLRAAADPARPATVTLAWFGTADRAPELSAADALARGPGMTSMLEPPGTVSGDRAPPAPRLVLPASATEGAPFQVIVEAGDVPFAAGVATWSVDGNEDKIPLVAGTRRVATPPVAVRAGPHVVAARFADRPPAAAVIRVAEAPLVLIVTPAAVEPPLARRLRTQGLRVVVASESTCDMAPAADVVVLGPGAGPACADDVASRVAAGSGLLVAGGEGPRGLARLRGTALEALLPVEIPAPPPSADPPPRPPEKPPRPDPEAPKPVLDEADRKALRVALLLIIDRSGSMGGIKLRMAQESAIAAAKGLSPGDRVGVIVFDEDPTWIVPFQDASDMRGLVQRIQDVDSGGGTNYYPALKTGYAAIENEDCGIRHVVLITDGISRPGLFGDIVDGGVAQGVTLSTVAIGEGANLAELGRMAARGKGRSYSADDPENLPQVLTLDTKKFVHAARDAAKEKKAIPDLPTAEPPVKPKEPETAEPPPPPEPPRGPLPRAPRVALAAPFLAGIESAPWPVLPHPESVRPRGAAIVPLVFDDGTPALVVGRAAAGRCAVAAADVVTADARELWTWPEGGRAMAQLARSLAPARAPTDDTPEVRFASLADGGAVAIVSAPGGGMLRLDQSGAADEIRVPCRAAGPVSLAELPAMPAAGLWSGEFVPAGADASTSVAASSAGAPPRDDAALAAELSARSGAPILRALPDRLPGRPVERHQDRSPPLLAAAGVLLLVEAALRRGVRG